MRYILQKTIFENTAQNIFLYQKGFVYCISIHSLKQK